MSADRPLFTRREMLRRAATDTISGVLGISKWGNWPYFAGSWAFDFIESRHGATRNRAERLESAWQTRRWLALDQTVDPALREELRSVKRGLVGTNPGSHGRNFLDCVKSRAPAQA